MGGIKTDVDGRCWDIHGQWSGIPGLFAAGEVACLSLHGGNRLGANSLLDTVVFGRRTGSEAAAYAQATKKSRVADSIAKQDEDMVKDFLKRKSTDDSIAKIRLDLGVTMNKNLGVFRDEDGILTAQVTLRDLRDRWSRVALEDKCHVFNTSLTRVLELGMMLDCAETIVLGALTRTESRGAHFRTDYISRDDDDWLKHILINRGSDGAPRIEYVPVKITQWTPQARIY